MFNARDCQWDALELKRLPNSISARQPRSPFHAAPQYRHIPFGRSIRCRLKLFKRDTHSEPFGCHDSSVLDNRRVTAIAFWNARGLGYTPRNGIKASHFDRTSCTTMEACGVVQPAPVDLVGIQEARRLKRAVVAVCELAAVGSTVKVHLCDGVGELDSGLHLVDEGALDEAQNLPPNTVGRVGQIVVVLDSQLVSSCNEVSSGF